MSCEKEDTNKDSAPYSYVFSVDMIQNMSEEEYNEYINNLIARTGIDIYKLSDITPVKKMLNKNIESFHSVINVYQPKGELTEAILERMQVLNDSIQLCYSLGQEYEVLILYQEFCQLCNGITGFVLNTGDYGIQTISFDGNIVNYPTAYLQAEVDQAQSIIDSISAVYPSYSSLPSETQTELLAATMVVKIREDISESKQTNPSDCVHDAQVELAVNLSYATAQYEAGLIACAISVAAAPSCIAAASAWYAGSCAVAYWQYKRAIKKC